MRGKGKGGREHGERAHGKSSRRSPQTRPTNPARASWRRRADRPGEGCALPNVERTQSCVREGSRASLVVNKHRNDEVTLCALCWLMCVVVCRRSGERHRKEGWRAPFIVIVGRESWAGTAARQSPRA